MTRPCPFSAASFVLSLRTMFDPARADGLDGRVGFRLGPETFVARLVAGAFAVEAGTPDDADVIFTATPPIVAAAIYGGQPLDALEADGVLKVEGDRALARRFVTLFPLPSKAAGPG